MAAVPETSGTLQVQSTEPATTVPSDTGTSGDFIHRYRPRPRLWEVGAFIGPLFISDNNSFRGPIVINPGRPPTVQPVSRFDQPAVEFGIRGGYFPLSFLGAELEGMIAAAQTDTNDGATVFAARGQAVLQLPYWSVVPFAVGGLGYWFVNNDVSGNDSDPAFHFGGGAKVNVARNVAVRFDLRDTITNQRASNDRPHNIEALAGASLVLGRPVQAVVEDGDGDGAKDDVDRCPFEAGPLPSGCPVRDADADGIPDPEDQCVSEPGLAPTGCPVRDADADGIADDRDQCIGEKGVAPTGCPDADGDGFLDRADQCPAVAGVAPHGCPADADGDGIVGADDRCPDEAETRNGFEDADGCPDELPMAVKNFMGVIAGIEFDTNQAAIRPSSVLALDKAASVLAEYPSLRVEISGHTDDTGSREHNLELSLRRAQAVKESLVSRGIDPNRIQTKGAGPDVPVTTNDSAAGRQKNRRIEFRVLE
ncbi:MAG TPA: OmpA family protein [Polyangiaceae bacterium]|nr:OmpA family protein [Polyangiaceae bacterium]